MTQIDAPSATPEDRLRRFIATRDPDELGALFDLTAPALLRVALATAPDAASAENAVQETFLAARWRRHSGRRGADRRLRRPLPSVR